MSRPDTPEFWDIVTAVQDLDSAADDGTSIERLVSVDMPTLAYVARQRALRLGSRSPAMAAMWIDGFAAGRLYAQQQAKKETTDETATDDVIIPSDVWDEFLEQESVLNMESPGEVSMSAVVNELLRLIAEKKNDDQGGDDN